MESRILREVLKGKTISDIIYKDKEDLPMCVDEIKFDDGSSIELLGMADNALIWQYNFTDGSNERIQEDNK